MTGQTREDLEDKALLAAKAQLRLIRADHGLSYEAFGAIFGCGETWTARLLSDEDPQFLNAKHVRHAYLRNRDLGREINSVVVNYVSGGEQVATLADGFDSVGAEAPRRDPGAMQLQLAGAEGAVHHEVYRAVQPDSPGGCAITPHENAGIERLDRTRARTHEAARAARLASVEAFGSMRAVR